MAAPARKDDLKRVVKNTVKQMNEAIRGDGPTFSASVAKAKQWLIDTVKQFRAEPSKQVTDYIIKFPGAFYMFYYESKLYNEMNKSGERKLPWYDAYPLILVFEVDKKGFTGLNFHYLPIKQRIMVLRKLMGKYKEKYAGNLLLRPMNWDILKQLTAFDKRVRNYAVKRYLWDHLMKIRGLRVVRVKNMDMLNSMFYISPQWVDIKEQKVLRDFNKAKRT
jgi:hypothetical protein